MNINKIFLWTEFPDILDSKQVLAPGSVFTSSLWGNRRVQMKANNFSRVCCVPPLLSFAPASFPSHPSWPAPPLPLLPRSKLPVLTAHILEEEEQTRDICGKGDYETGLTRPLLTPGHHAHGSWYRASDSDRMQVWLYFLNFGISAPRF